MLLSMQGLQISSFYPKSVVSKSAVGATAAIVTIWTANKIHRVVSNYQERSHLTSLRKRKQKERAAQFDEYKKTYPISEADEEIVSLNFRDLQQRLQSRQLKAEDVLRAFIAKSLEVQDEFNCITEFIPNAMERAKELDELEKPKGPLHGLPFCVKDDTNVKGMDSTVGCCRLLYKPAKESAVIVQTLENLGAIAFCRTNVPQTCLSIGSDNPIFGKTLNPLNKKLGPGGSSSGSACLVAAGGCPFGTGSDTGGSLRIPAHSCGISTLRSTSNRISDDGCLRCSPDLTAVPGILIKRANDLAFIYESMIVEQLKHTLDAKVPPILWNADVFHSEKKLRIGYFTAIAALPPMGDAETVTLNAKSFLEKAGHELIPFEMPDHTRCWMSMMAADAMAKHFFQLTKNDEIASCIQQLNKIFKSVPTFPWKAAAIKFLGLEVFGLGGNPVSLDANTEKIAFANAILRRMEELQVDLLLCPAFVFPAIGVDYMVKIRMKLHYATIYSFIWNLVNFPAGVVKFGNETGSRWQDSDIFVAKIRNECIGMPIGVQIIGKPFQEEQVLRILAQLDKVNSH